MSPTEEEEPSYDRHTRRHNVLHDLFLRQSGLVNPRRATHQLMRRLYTHGSSLRYVGNMQFKRGHFDLHDHTIVARPNNANDSALQVFSLRRAELDSRSCLRHPPPVLVLPRQQLQGQQPQSRQPQGRQPQDQQPCNRSTVTVEYSGSGYPYDDLILPEDYRPALFVLSQNVLSRYDSLTYRLLSQHSLAFAGVSLTDFNIDYEADWLVVQSSRQNKSPWDGSSEPIDLSRTGPRLPDPPVLLTVFVVFKLHPFHLQRCFTVSNEYFPSSEDKALYGTLVSVEYSGTFLLLTTSGMYTLFYDFSKFVEHECTGQVIKAMTPGPVLLAVPACRMLSAGGLGGFSSLLFGSSFFTMQLSSLEKMLFLTALMMAGRVEDIEIDNISLRRSKLSSPERITFLTERMMAARVEDDERGRSNSDRKVRAALLKACGPRVLDLLQHKYTRDNHLESNLHFFPGNFNRLVLTTEFDLRIFELPSPEDYCNISSLNHELLAHSGSFKPRIRRPVAVTSSGRRVRLPERTESVCFPHRRGNKHFSYTVSHDCNLVFVLIVNLKEYWPSKLQSLAIYDIFTLKLLREIPLDVQLGRADMLFDVKFELCVNDDTIMVVRHGLRCHDVYCFKLRHSVPP